MNLKRHVPTIIIVGTILANWSLLRSDITALEERVSDRIAGVEERVSGRIAAVDMRIGVLEERVVALSERVARIEGVLSGQVSSGAQQREPSHVLHESNDKEVTPGNT